jgi:drug/metabolite transporter (DMT)-like permease
VSAQGRRTAAHSCRAALLFSLEPFFAAIFSYLIMGQVLSGKEWMGGILVVAGILLGLTALVIAGIYFFRKR